MKTEIQAGTTELKPILEARRLSKEFAPRALFGSAGGSVKAFDGVDISLCAGRTLAIVGESGSGKSTLARCLVRLEEPTSGEIQFEGRDFLALSGDELRDTRKKMQLIFQEAMSALNPRFTAWEIVAEPLVIANQLSEKALREETLVLMEQVGLPQAWAARGAHEFSGGQKQRLALARALAANPRVVILDEALSGLDLSVQAQMINLLLDLQAARELAYIFISHDLSLVGAIADEVAVMKNGIIVERGDSFSVLSHPRHPYTQLLVSAMAGITEGVSSDSAVRA